MKTILVSLICFNNENEVISFLNEIKKQNFENIRLIISITCTNKKDEKNLIKMVHDVPKDNFIVKIYNAGKNLGYLNGCIYGINQCILEFGIPKWIVISNTDIEIKSNNFFEDFIKQEFNDNIWCIGPSIIDNTKQYKNPYLKKRPTKRSLFIKTLIYRYNFLNNLYFKLYFLYNQLKTKKSISNENSSYTYAVHGCFFIISFPCFQEIIKDSKKIFMYGEENLIGEIVRINEKFVYYWSIGQVYHNNNQVTGKISDNKKMQWKRQSLKFILERYYE